MLPALLVVDDFLSDPMQVRDAALKLPYPPATSNAYYPGRNSGERLFIEGLDAAVGALVREPLEPAGDLSHAQTRIALAGDKGAAGVHVDNCHWTGVLCLSLTEHCHGGTDFFRHLPTGTDRAPLNGEERAAIGLTDPQEVWDRILSPHTNDPEKWERTTHVPHRFNRLILFRPWYWHDAGPGFGDSVETGRLIYTMFYRRTAAA
ncbi:MAG: DUF6445 family protein [Pseudomonadota bacterium]